ncbi:unnamed protein product [Parnassius mnemosyne]|uniref:Uncharacterized protein n=1 Tax=Parnassius mnemosyne TaxID=213953 RepID=A0AAV1KFV7_9NEOP
MEIVERQFHEKNNTISSFVRNTSCSRGWLRLVVQTTFGIITVVSFVLIVNMAFYRAPSNRPNPQNRCLIDRCRVQCNGVPYYNNYEEDIINAAMEAESNCKTIFLILKNPMFVNSILPLNWLSDMRSNIRTVSVIGGNLNQIPPHAFMSPFATNVRSLFLEDITITSWVPETFIGLSNLKELFIKNCKLLNIHYSALRTIDDTLKTLDIKATNIWNPTNVTGTADLIKLTTVDFSKNDFLDVLDESSFYELQNCKILYLNSCKITSIGNGTFDRLMNLQILFLNNNHIYQVPEGLFNVLLSLEHKPRINLQDNPWICQCSNNDLRNLHLQDLLIVEPSCYYPIEIRGFTFTEFENYCTNYSQTELIISDTNGTNRLYEYKSNKTFNMNSKLTCDGHNKQTDSELFTLISPFSEYQCLNNRIHNIELVPLASNAVSELLTKSSSWIKPIFYSKSHLYSLVEIDLFGPSSYSLIWFRSACPKEVYCVSSLPKVLRVYNVNNNAYYTFCRTKNGTILNEECVVYDLSKFNSSFNHNTSLLYILTAFICLSSGALCVYWLIRKNPGLLKGSKRVLFVKHKQVDALVLPPKIPSRNNLTGMCSSSDKSRNIFIVSPHINSSPWKFVRMNSTRSTNSSPSYISAIQPSEDQLAQWRLRHHYDKDSTIRSMDSNISTLSWIFDAESVPYFHLDNNEPLYDHINFTERI